MPFFRCGGTSLSAIAQKVMYEKLYSCLGDNPDLSINILCDTVENGFGVGDSNTMTVNIGNRTITFDNLKRFFEYYNYSVTIPPISTSYPDVWFQIWQLKGDDNGKRPESQQNNSPSGSITQTIFHAEYKEPDYMNSFEEKQCNSLRKVVGDHISWSFTISDYWEGDPVRTYYRRLQYSAPLSISILLQNCGYSITNSANIDQEVYRDSNIQGGKYSLSFLSAIHNGSYGRKGVIK